MKYTVEISSENWSVLKNYIGLITGDSVSHYYDNGEIPVKFTLPWAEVEAEIREASASEFSEILLRFPIWEKCARELKELHS